MMIDGEPTDNFAEFEAAATAAEPSDESAKAVEPEEGDEQRGEDDEPPAEVNDKADDDEEGEDRPEKRRSKPAHQRIAELTAKLRQAERDLEATKKPAEVKPAEPAPVSTIAKPDPYAKNDDGSDKYEFGEADPVYIADMVEYRVDERLAADRAKTEAEQNKAAFAETITNLDGQWKEKATKATEEFPDFNEVVLETAAAGDWKCGLLMSMAISASDQGHRIAYHLAKNPDEAAELDALSDMNNPKFDPYEASRRFGRLEARFEGAGTVTPLRKVTNAPEPPKHQVRGGSGKFEVDGSTTDFAAFEKKAMGK